MHDITMPKLSDSMETGQIVSWRVKEGDAVHEGDVLAEIESDKAVMELECFHDGTIAEIVRGEGDEVTVGEVIGRIAAGGESTPGKAEEKPAKKEEPPEKKEPPKEEKPKKQEPVKAPGKKAEKKAEKKPSAPAGEVARIPISPYARKLAAEKGVDLSTLTGTGPGGRIDAKDVEAAAKQPAKKTEPQAAPAEPTKEPEAKAEPEAEPEPEEPKREPEAQAEPEEKKERKAKTVVPSPSPDDELPELVLRPDEATVEEAPFRLRTMARRVVASKHVIPHFYVTRGADVTDLMSRQRELKETRGLSVTHVVMLASIAALRKHPDINRSYDHGRIIRWKGIHLGLAVDTKEGLTVAVLRDAQDLDAAELVQRTRALVGRAREGKLSGEERRHPTFTISNLGMFDVEHFEPIVNPPSAITLAVASALEVPLVRDGKVLAGREMKLTLSCDHRIIDGVQAAEFLAELVQLVEHPDALLK